MINFKIYIKVSLDQGHTSTLMTKLEQKPAVYFQCKRKDTPNNDVKIVFVITFDSNDEYESDKIIRKETL